jgi:hypothetical protein
MMAYLDAHPELAGPTLGGRTLGNINPDMVGENLEIIHTKMILTRTPASIPSVVNDVVEEELGLLDRQAEGLSATVAGAARRRGAATGEAPPLPRATDDRIPVRLTRGPLAGGLPAADWRKSGPPGTSLPRILSRATTPSSW